MKQFIEKLWVTLFALTIAMPVWAYDFEVDGIYYNVVSLSDRTCSITYKEKVEVNGLRGGFNDYSKEILTIPSTVEYAGQTLSVIGINVQAYEYNTAIKKVIIPNTIQWLHQECFDECTSLEEVVIEEGDGILKFYKLGRTFYFSKCPITKLFIGRQIEKEDDSGLAPFAELTKLNDVEFSDKVTSLVNGMFGDCTSLTEITLPESCTAIGKYAFAGCTNLKTVNIKGNLSEIQTSAFSECASLSNINLGSLSVLGESAFNKCTSLTKIEWTGEPTILPKNAFMGCKSLKEFTIPATVTTIDEGVFNGCESLSSISIPASVTQIKMKAFADCSNLKKFVIEDANEKLILASTFQHDDNSIFGQQTNDVIEQLEIYRPISNYYDLVFSNLKTIRFGDGFGSVNYNPSNLDFMQSPLESIYSNLDNPPSIGPYGFSTNQYMTVPVFVPTESVELYKAETDWSKFWQIQGYDFDSSGVNTIVSDVKEKNSEYYLLNGTRLQSEPIHGAYIMRQGATTRKILK